jgi:hypothetical protein
MEFEGQSKGKLFTYLPKPFTFASVNYLPLLW